ncbi:AAA family ATPase [Mycobacteroides abscessus subsp. massiliense]|uniref:AAA family ATPase n=1 Tax=Mycobacteroides abscessus TaxID=36809 RepID=UPI00266C2DC1|nr:AAA family ATPase [Mycobacteroides abscessus]MDO3299760.1 AAA family ATPase [Mycobacteroides abscessus subsp. massiliense]
MTNQPKAPPEPVLSERQALPQMNGLSGNELAIEIRDCNSISDATITLRQSALNIKYGANGVGKSTIASALQLHAEGNGSLEVLVPFKHRGVDGAPPPTVVGADSIQKVLVFNDDYVSQFVFRPDEVLKDSFEVFINTDEYRHGLAQIDSLFQALKDTFSQDEEFDAALVAFTALRDAFNVTKAGAIAKTSKGLKAIGMGGKLARIPEPLQGYKQFLEGEDPASWITWQAKGKLYLDQSENCPFCSSPSLNKQIAQQVSEEYESSAVKNLTALRKVIDQLGDYFEESKRDRLRGLLTSLGELSPEQSAFLANLRTQVETFLTRLKDLRALSFHTLRDAADINDLLQKLKIDLPLLDALNSAKTTAIVGLINDKLDEVAGHINELRAGLGKQRSRVATLIKVNQDAVNEFLSSAGYRYSVKIEETADSYRMIVEHEDSAGHLESASRHLSYGEKNAFALVLFMHHVRKERPDLVVLDDPVSSFDKTKKFAILHQLFHGKTSIREFTTLLLTHDIEPAIDIVLNATAGQFAMTKPIAHFLRSSGGSVRETLIEKHHFSTFSQVCTANIATSSDDVIKCIYLRRFYEVHGDLGNEYQILSSLLHVRDVAASKGSDGELTPISTDEFEAGMAKIREWIPSLDYTKVVQELHDPAILKAKFGATDVGYEKVQLFRVLLAGGNGAKVRDEAFQKFVNESYHIENEYVMQLNPRDFDAVPEHVLRECEARLAEAAG